MSKPERPEPPRHLSAEARALWRSLHERWEFEEHELKTLSLALEALDRTSQARRALKRHGLVYEDRFGAPHARPEMAIERDARQSWPWLMAALELPAEEDPAQPKTLRGQFGRKTERGRGAWLWRRPLMARRRRPEPVESTTSGVDAEPVTILERIDPRALLHAPDELRADVDAFLASVAQHYPWAIKPRRKSWPSARTGSVS